MFGTTLHTIIMSEKLIPIKSCLKLITGFHLFLHKHKSGTLYGYLYYNLTPGNMQRICKIKCCNINRQKPVLSLILFSTMEVNLWWFLTKELVVAIVDLLQKI